MIILKDLEQTFLSRFGTLETGHTITFQIVDSTGAVLSPLDESWTEEIISGDNDAYVESGSIVELNYGEYASIFVFNATFTGFIRFKTTLSDSSEVIVSEPITVIDNYGTDIKRLLGLHHENMYIDTPVYDVYNNLTSARIRIYSIADSVGTANNVLATYTITAAGTGVNKFSTFKQVLS